MFAYPALGMIQERLDLQACAPLSAYLRRPLHVLRPPYPPATHITRPPPGDCACSLTPPPPSPVLRRAVCLAPAPRCPGIHYRRPRWRAHCQSPTSVPENHLALEGTRRPGPGSPWAWPTARRASAQWLL